MQRIEHSEVLRAQYFSPQLLMPGRFQRSPSKSRNWFTGLFYYSFFKVSNWQSKRFFVFIPHFGLHVYFIPLLL